MMQKIKLLAKLVLVLAIVFVGLSEAPAAASGCSPSSPGLCQDCSAEFCDQAASAYCVCYSHGQCEVIVACGDCELEERL